MANQGYRRGSDDWNRDRYDRERSGRYGTQQEQFDAGFGYDYDNERGSGQFGETYRDTDRQQDSWQSDRNRGGQRDWRGADNDRAQFGRYGQRTDRNRSSYGGRDAGSIFATGAGSQLAAGRGEWHDPDSYGTAPSARRGYRDDERGFFERAGDEIASWFGDDDAQRRRERDYRGHGPSGYTRSDERIREDVNDRLTDDYRIDARNVTVTVANGEVTLDGTVGSRDQKRRAEDLVDDLSGVKHVQNNLRVQDAGSIYDRAAAGDTTL